MSTEACKYHVALATKCPVHVVLFSVLTIKCIKTIKSWLNIWHCRAGICSGHSTSSKHFRVGWLWFYYIIINVETVTSHKYIVKIAEVCLGPSRKTIGKVIKYFLWNTKITQSKGILYSQMSAYDTIQRYTVLLDGCI